MTKIYLVQNCYGDPNKVYIGKTINSRESNHKRTYGKEIEYTYIDEIDSLYRKDWGCVESYWIEQFRQWGFDVVNIRKKGGSGREFFTNEDKDKLRKPRPDYVKEKIGKSNLGKKRTEETKLKISLIKKGFKHSEESKLKMRNKVRSEESKQKQSETTKGRKITWDLGTKGKNISQEQKDKISLGNSKSVGQYDNTWNLINIFNSYTESKIKTGIDCQNTLSGRTKTSGGFKWKYL